MDTDRSAREVNVITKVNLVLCLFTLVQLLVTKKSILERSIYLAMYLFSIKALIMDKKTHQVLAVQKMDSAIHLAPVVQTLDSAIHRINHYPADSVIDFRNIYPLDSDLSGG